MKEWTIFGVFTHEGAVLAARFNSEGTYYLSCGKDHTIRLWNPHHGIHIKTYKSHAREVRNVHITPYSLVSLNQLLIQSLITIFYVNFFFFRDNLKLCSCGGDRKIFYWDVSTCCVICKFRGHDGEVCFLFLFLILTVFQVYQIIFCWIFNFIKFGNFYWQ